MQIAPSTATPVLAFEDVNLIPMTDERIIPNQTVLVENGIITKIGNAKKTKIPKDAIRIKSTGKFLMPGLMDMHVHLFADGDFPDKYAKDELKVMVANGVTTNRIMSGNENHLLLRKQINEQKITGPALFIASPEIAGKAYYKAFKGEVVQTPEQAVAAVKKFKQAGYDFIKLTYGISVPVYEAITRTAREVNIPVIGHIGPEVKLRRALESGQQIEHLDEYLEALLPAGAPNDGKSVSDVGVWQPQAWETLDYIDEQKIAEVVSATKKAGVYNTPTSTFLHMAFGTGMHEEEIASRPDLHFIPPAEIENMHQTRNHYLKNMPSEERRMKYIAVRNQLIKALHEAGCKLMAGSDTPSWLLTYGFTLHRELEHFVQAGLSAYAALQTATVNPAAFLKIADKAGTIETGKRADLLLLDANPLTDIRNTRQIQGVMCQGNYFDKNALAQMLNEAAEIFK
jgi:imidazolonepropionase-like amidohydrolase